MFDLVVRNGILVDPGQGIHGRRDVAFKDGRVALVAEDIRPSEAARAVDVDGRYVFPGLIDLHTHVYPKVTDLGVDADADCLAGGVTTSVDAGSAGSITFPGFRDYVLPHVKSRVYAYVHLSSIGLVNSRIGELKNMEYADPEGAARTIAAHPERCLGIKVRMAHHRVAGHIIEPLLMCLGVAERIGCSIMIHITYPARPLAEMFDLLRPGDVITHLLHGRDETVVSGGKVIEALWRAQRRGVGTDVGHGSGSFSFATARAALADGFRPTSISTDVHVRAAKDEPPRQMMGTVMSKFLALGMTLDEVVAATTIDAARTIRKDGEIGSLRPGLAGDLAVFELREGRFTFTDCEGETVHAEQKLVPALTVLGGEVAVSHLAEAPATEPVPA